MHNLIVLVGPPGSGKSTHAKTLAGTRISQDESGKDHLRLYNEALSRGEDIVVDRMGFDQAQRARYIDLARTANYKVTIRIFVVPRKICYDRVVARIDNHETINSEHSAKSAVNLFFAKYTKPLSSEADSIEFINYGGGVGEDKPRAVICDLDGTLCNVDHRLHFVRKNVEGKKPNWYGFFKGLEHDSVNEWCATILKNLSGSHEIVYCSGRPEEYREATEKWLKDNSLWYGHLFMRSAGDHRQDNVVKDIILDFDILTQFEPQFAIDDRQQVVDMWRSRGIVCLQCAKGDF